MSLTKTIQSVRLPGASFVLRAPGRKLRNRVELDLCETLYEQTLVAQEQYSIIPEEVRADEKNLEQRLKNLSLAEQNRLTFLRIRQNALFEVVRLAYAKHMLESFTLPGEEYQDITTPEEVLESGPVAFADEIIDAAQDMWRITVDETKNSLPPSTSPAPVDGQTKAEPGTATTAASAATTSSAAAS
jgi:hypothetical protein